MFQICIYFFDFFRCVFCNILCNINIRYRLNETIRNKESLPSISESSNELPVPQLKVGADGQVVIDMDTLVSIYTVSFFFNMF